MLLSSSASRLFQRCPGFSIKQCWGFVLFISIESINKRQKYYFASSPYCLFPPTHLSIKLWPKLNAVPIISFIDLFVILGTWNLLQYLISAIWYYFITFPETCFSYSLNFSFFTPLHPLCIWFRLFLPTQDPWLLCAWACTHSISCLVSALPSPRKAGTAFWSAKGVLPDLQPGNQILWLLTWIRCWWGIWESYCFNVAVIAG